jgi:hypothetical protein
MYPHPTQQLKKKMKAYPLQQNGWKLRTSFKPGRKTSPTCSLSYVEDKKVDLKVEK